MVTMDNKVGFGIDFNGFTLPFARFRVAGTIDPNGAGAQAFSVFAQAICEQIDFYGTFLRQLGFCNPESDILAAAGAVELLLIDDAMTPTPAGGTMTWSRAVDGPSQAITATLSGSTLVAADHNLGILVVDGDGQPVACDYVEGTTVAVDDAGHPTGVTVTCPAEVSAARAYLMVDVSAVAAGELAGPR